MSPELFAALVVSSLMAFASGIGAHYLNALAFAFCTTAFMNCKGKNFFRDVLLSTLAWVNLTILLSSAYK